MRKKGAMELSISTVVVIVLAMSMLILGLILVRSIFTGAKYNIEKMNEKVEGEINKLFVEDKRAVLYLPNRLAEVKQGDVYGVSVVVGVPLKVFFLHCLVAFRTFFINVVLSY